VSNEPQGAALKVGPHATRIVEPRQARKGATVRRPSRVPWEYLTGAGFLGRSRYGSLDGGCTVTLYEREVGLKRRWAEIDGRGFASRGDRSGATNRSGTGR
jgi:hypothetical protein